MSDEKLYIIKGSRSIDAAVIELEDENGETETVEAAPVQHSIEEVFSAISEEQARQLWHEKYEDENGNLRASIVSIEVRNKPKVEFVQGKGYVEVE